MYKRSALFALACICGVIALNIQPFTFQAVLSVVLCLCSGILLMWVSYDESKDLEGWWAHVRIPRSSVERLKQKLEEKGADE